jgi:hypothetical protein
MTPSGEKNVPNTPERTRRRDRLNEHEGRDRHPSSDLVDPAMIEIGSYGTRLDAETAQAALAAEGIPSVVAADDAGGAYPFDLSGGPRLLVNEADVGTASAILDNRAGRKETDT